MTTLYQNNKRTFTVLIYLFFILIFFGWLQQNYLINQAPNRMILSTIIGILLGGLYGLVGLGIVIINKSSGVFNFAHGWMMLVGGLFFYSFFAFSEISVFGAGLLSTLTVVMILTTVSTRTLREPRPLALGIGAIILLTGAMTVGGRELQWLHGIVGAVVGSALLGLVVERFTIRPLIGQPLFTAVLMTLAVAEVLQSFTQMAWGSVEIALPIYQSLDALIPEPIVIDATNSFLASTITIRSTVIRIAAEEGSFIGGNVIIQMGLLVSFILAIVAFGAFILFFRFTNIGLAMRATAENQQLAESTGLRVRAILAVAWGIAALLAAIAGTLQGGATTLSLNMPLLALRAFPAVLLGGLESIEGALVGGLVIGLVEQWGILLFPNQVGTDLAPYLVLMVVLVIRPEGLFGQKRIERI